MNDRSTLEAARLESLDSLLRSLDVRWDGDGRYRARGEPGPFGRTFGGQLVAQAVVAAGATVDGKVPSSLHAVFAGPGVPTEDNSLDVVLVRDGRTAALRDVTIEQGENVLLRMLASFGAGADGSSYVGDATAAADPASLPELQDWISDVPGELRESSKAWLDCPPPVEIRIAEPPVFFGGRQRQGPRQHWMRLARPVDGGALLEAALLAHASDYLLLDMAFRSLPVPFASRRVTGTSLDHAVWFHRPTQLHRWHCYTQETVALLGERGVVRGTIHDEDGRLVASTAQEVLVRVTDPADPGRHVVSGA